MVDYDYKIAAIELTDVSNWCSTEAAYTTMNASPDEIAGSCWNTGPNYNRWFKFEATTNEILVRMLTGGTEGTLRFGYIALWDDLNNQLACSRYTYDYQDLSVSSQILTPGHTYYISVDNYNNTAYRGTFSLCLNDAVDYDFKDGAITISNYHNYCSALEEYTTIGASPDELKGTCWNTGPNFNRWFKFLATGSEVTISVKTGGPEGSLRYPYVALWDNSNNQVACATYTNDYNDIEITSSTLTSGNWYYISVDNYNNLAYRGTFTLCMNDAQSYDFKNGAIVLSDLNGWCSTGAAFSTLGATADQARGSCWPNGPNYNRWFKFQATSSSVSIQVRTTGSEGTLRRPMAALWTDGMAEVACRIYSTDNSDIEVSSTSLNPGDWYFISVDNSVGTGYRGSFTICLTDHIPNDDIINAFEIIDLNSWCSGDAGFTNSIASPDGPAGSCFGGGTNTRNVWFKFLAQNPKVTINITTGGDFGSMSGQQIALFNSSNTEVGCSAPIAGQGINTLIATTLTTGQWYWISVDANITPGTFTICVDDDNPYPYPPGAELISNISNWCSTTAGYTNIGASPSTFSGACWTGATFNIKWFKFIATTNEIDIQVSTGGIYGTMQRQQVALWDAAGIPVACAVWVSNQGTITMQTDELIPGSWYWIAVDDDRTSGTFSLCVNDEVDFNYKARAEVISNPTNWCSSDAAYSNLFATDDEDMGSCWTSNNGGNKNVWFKFNAATDFIKIEVKTGGVYGNMQRQQLALWDASGTEISCTKYVTNQGIVILQTDQLTPLDDYYISVDDDLVSGTFTLCTTDQVDYDFFAGALEITNTTNWCSADAAYSNLFATDDEDMGSCWVSNNGGNKNVWFKFNADNNYIKIQVKTGGVYGNMQRQQVALWDASGTEISCTKYVTNQGIVILQTDQLTPLDDYYISVDDDLVSGTFTLCLTNIVDYDFKAGAVTISNTTNWCSADAAYSNLFATDDEDMGSCWVSNNGGNKNVWFKFNADNNYIKIQVKTGGVYGNMQRQQVALWDASGTEIACTRYVTNQGIIILQTDQLIPLDDYYISVDDDLVSGTFTLCLTNIVDYDFIAGAVTISNTTNWCSADAAYSNLFATDDEDMGSCWVSNNGGNKNVWFKFNADNNYIKIQVKTGGVYGNMQRQQVALWDASGTEIACARYVTNQGIIILQTDQLIPLDDYYISVDDDLVSGTFHTLPDQY